jgi:hypothetical protein
MEKQIGRRYCAWGGAINIILPVHRDGYIENRLLRPNDFSPTPSTPNEREARVLGIVTHRMNVPNTWKHISLENVAQASLRAKLARAIASDAKSLSLSEYEQLIQESADEIRGNKEQIEDIGLRLLESEERIVNLDDVIRSKDHEILSLKATLDAQDNAGQASGLSLEDARELVRAFQAQTPALPRILSCAGRLFPDRIRILDSAKKSAEESIGFRATNDAFDLIWLLATDYWESLSTGGGDQQGKNLFGNGFAQNEGQALSKDGKKRRTFIVDGRPILMEKHLKIGVKDSVYETLRIHFHWIAEKKLIVIGHCGKHLDF